ncbi:hypothetical protein LCGC14_2616350, partial [marine sediment metagenome]
CISGARRGRISYQEESSMDYVLWLVLIFLLGMAAAIIGGSIDP